MTPWTRIVLGSLGMFIGLVGVPLGASGILVLVVIGMAYGGLALAFTGYLELESSRASSRQLSRAVPILQAVLESVSPAETEPGTVTGRFGSHWVAIDTEEEVFGVRLLVEKSDGHPWVVEPHGRGWRLRTWSPDLEERLRDAGVISMIADSPELKRFAAPRSRWSVGYSPAQRCGHTAHSSNRITYYVEPRRHLWRRVTDEEMRALLEQLAVIADINEKVNSGLEAAVAAPSGPPRWQRYVDRGFKAALAVAVAAMVTIIGLEAIADVDVFGRKRRCITTLPPASVCIYEQKS